MKKYILDTNILIRDPSILAKHGKEVEFIIPESVIYELNALSKKNSNLRETFDFVQNSLEKGVHRINFISTDSLVKSQLQSLITPPRNSGPDELIIAYAKWYIKANINDAHSVFFVTEDKSLAQYAESEGINTIGLNKLQQELEKIAVIDDETNEQAKQVVGIRRRRELLNLFIGVILGLAINWLVGNIDRIIATINIWGTIVSFPLLVFGLFWFRSKNRLTYGVLEFVFGFFTSVRVFFPNFDFTQLVTAQILQIIGGLYIMVRGMDNIGKSIIGSSIEPIWRKLFGD